MKNLNPPPPVPAPVPTTAAPAPSNPSIPQRLTPGSSRAMPIAVGGPAPNPTPINPMYAGHHRMVPTFQPYGLNPQQGIFRGTGNPTMATNPVNIPGSMPSMPGNPVSISGTIGSMPGSMSGSMGGSMPGSNNCSSCTV